MIRRMKNFWVVGSLILLTFLTSCLDNDFPDPSIQLAADVQKIEKHLTDNNITNYVKDPSGFFYVIDQEGTGQIPTGDNHVNFTYVAKFLNGTTAFQQTSMPVFHTVKRIGLVGLREALKKFPNGTIATIYIPSGLAYGTASYTDIPANSNFIFNIEIFNVVGTEEEIFEIQKTMIDEYLLENEIEDVQIHPSGLRYKITQEGTGDSPTTSNSISVKYKGTLLSSGETFDEATTARTFVLNTLIQGWQIVFPLLKEGSKATLYIPSKLGYGASGYNTIPGHAILKFEVELVDVVQ